MTSIITAVLVVFGALLSCLATLGLLRMPDVFMRLQAAAKAGTLGVGFVVLAAAIHFGDVGVATRALLIVLFLFATAPVAAHAIARAAYHVGVPLFEGTVRDELREHLVAMGRAPRAQPEDSTAELDRGLG